jgi:mRNA-degrading endonuclease RelE of RelBE toxin-antitoxin system
VKENIRDYFFKGYVVVYEVDVENEIVSVFGFIKYKDPL